MNPSDIVGPALGLLSAVFVAWFAYRGSKSTDKTDKLTKAAGLFSDYADKQEENAEKLAAKVERMDAEQDAMKVAHAEAERRQQDTNTKLNNRLNGLEAENAQYKTLLSEVIRWITELLDWETRGYPDPAPRMTLAMVLAHLTSALDQSAREREREQATAQKTSSRGGTRRANR